MRKQIFPLVFGPAFLFPLAVFFIALRNPSIFPFFLDPPFPVIFFFILAISILIFFLKRANHLQENIHGLILLFLFTMGYFILSALFNRADLNTNNIYFEADSWSWLRRMALEDGWQMGTRAVHPLTPILFRPLIAALSIFSTGDRYQAGLFLLSLAGGGCVFLMWKIVRQISADEVNAILFASLLGLSASHLTFAAVVETYIFSAFCLLLFVWLLLNNRSAYTLMVVGIVTFGITITNIIQQGITFLLVQRDLKRAAMLFTCVLLIGVGLNVFSRVIYPATEYVFLPQNILEEQSFKKEITPKRAVLMAENLFIYNIAAPQPYTKIRDEVPRFNFLNETIKEYAWFGWPALILWLITLGTAIFYFFKNFHLNPQATHLAAAMLGCLFFNYFLHVGYGVESFLYSPDWTYALVLFTALSLNALTQRNWVKLMLFLLVLSVFVNNMWFLYLIAGRTSVYLG
jgi:hypothetical protein